MNTFKNIRLTLIAVFSLLVINSCVKDDDWSTPPYDCVDLWDTDITIGELTAIVDADGEIHYFDENLILEGYVVSSDYTGNFFKSVVIQDKLENPTIGLQVEMDRPNLSNSFPMGAKIKVNLNDLHVGYDRGMLKVGDTYDSNGIIRVGRMANYKIDTHVGVSCDDIVQATPVVFNNLTEMFNNGAFNTLATIKNVQFADEELGKTYADAINQETKDRKLVDVNGTTVILRNSGFADFAGEPLPSESGSITVVISGYDLNNNGTVSNSEYQLMISDLSDVQFDQPRFGDEPDPDIEYDYFGCLIEDFNSYSVDFENFTQYENRAVTGDRKWRVTEFSGNNYIQATAFNHSGEMKTYFVIPVDFSKADKFSFKTKDGYNNGDPLKVLYSTTYVPGGDIASANFTDITSNFNISTGNTNGYADNFLDSGEYSLASLSGEGVIVFAYEGNGNGVTTTIQIDDIHVIDNDDPDCEVGGGGGDDPDPPSGDAVPLFPGHDFEDWGAFLGGLNNFGLQNYATQSTGTGFEGSNSLHISTNPDTTNGNDYVFTNLASTGLPSSYTKINFYMKGSSAKSVSLNVYDTNGDYYKFNLGTITGNATIQQAGNNQYGGTIDTSGDWVLVTLDLSGISNLNVSDTSNNFFALKIGKNADYDLHFDNFTIE